MKTDNKGEQVLLTPRPPSANALYSNVRGKGRVKTRQYRDWIWPSSEPGWGIKTVPRHHSRDILRRIGKRGF